MPRYIAFHKPYGVLSQFTGEAGQRTLAEFSLPPNVYAAGRLDKDSEGLLLLSDDGPFIKRLLDPENGHERTYWAEVEGIPGKADMAKLSKGVMFGGYQSKPCRAELITPQPEMPPRDPPVRFRKSIPTCWITLTLTEGKNRQVRRMTAATGFPTLRLIRQRIGRLELGDLPMGAWRDVRKSDIF
ncbi:MAG: pseudouridine synthase [Sneathiella sp.]|jgi:23S rRNA pseudouridine2457 synthase|uniref:pseudouridine synthase n=1 Tax=Sneathiella sp. TaxID=1964365 RepID=UPI000C6BEA97|nr:pseudouridine synthase [Sneathiella sp.]MAL80507.1 pseudouridine synthase [Sneathiella sp.]|tara:strand:- start:326 stop:880 length:555 start_codon:yes stop_codon:yes gene_type:complete